MKKLKLSKLSKCICLGFMTALAALSWGCGKSGAIDDPLPEASYQTPSIQNLNTKNTNIAKCTGGILSFTCDYISPWQVTSANAYLSFVRTIDKTVTEPIGIIGSASSMIIDNSVRASFSNAPISSRMANTKANELASDTVNDPMATEDFYRKYAEPILIPVRIASDETAGQFYAQIPFTTGDIASAPLGVHQMMVYLKINNYKTNTLSFELTFVP